MDVTFMCLDHMWNHVMETLYSSPETKSRNGACREIVGYSAKLLKPGNCILYSDVRRAKPSYGAAECLWYLHGNPDTSFIRLFAPQYAKWTEDDGTAHGAYGARLRSVSTKASGSQLWDVVNILRTTPDSRQAIVTLWDACSDLKFAVGPERRKDLPCTLSLQFLLREGRLHLVATMRSNDVWLGMPYDVFAFCTIQALVAEMLGVPLGVYYHRAGSLHLYDRDRDVFDSRPRTKTFVHDATRQGIDYPFNDPQGSPPPTEREVEEDVVEAVDVVTAFAKCKPFKDKHHNMTSLVVHELKTLACGMRPSPKWNKHSSFAVLHHNRRKERIDA